MKDDALAIAFENSFAKPSRRYLRVVRDESEADADRVEWIVRNRWIHGEPWSFDTPGPIIDYGKHDIQFDRLYRPYLYQWLRDLSREKSTSKPRQSEFTENTINETLFHLLTRPFTSAHHVFPTDELGDAISRQKINTAITDSPKIARKLRRNAVREKLFLNGSMYTISGALKKSGGRATSKDIVIYDEKDFQPETIEGVYNEQLSHSPLRLIWRVSTPTSPGVGIDANVQEGTGYRWTWRCEKCKKWNEEFKFPDSIVGYFDRGTYDLKSDEYLDRLDGVYLGCVHCGHYCDRNSKYYIRHAHWAAAFESMIGSHASYRVLGAMIPWKTGKELLRMFHKLEAYPTTYFNEVWGTAHVKGENILTKAEITACTREWVMAVQYIASLSNICMGIDWGEKVSWVIVGASDHDSDRDLFCTIAIIVINDEFLERNGIEKKDPHGHTNAVKKLVKQYRPEIIVNDANGIGSDRNKSLISEFPQKERTWGAFFDTAESGRQLRQSKLLVPQWQKQQHRVMFSKVGMVKEIMRLIRERKVGLPREAGPGARNVNLMHTHLTGLTVQPRWDITYDREYEMVVKLGEDHLFCALMYAFLGFEKLTGVGYGNRVPGSIAPR